MSLKEICIFTGHRDLPRDLYPIRAALARRMLQLADEGICRFLCGGARGFDLLAGELTLELRELRPEIRLELVLPCHGQDRYYTPEERRRYGELLDRADSVHHTGESYYRGCMLTRDRIMAQAAHACICYLTRSGGGTAYTVRQVLLRDVPVYNLAEDLENWEEAQRGPVR